MTEPSWVDGDEEDQYVATIDQQWSEYPNINHSPRYHIVLPNGRPACGQPGILNDERLDPDQAPVALRCRRPACASRFPPYTTLNK